MSWFAVDDQAAFHDKVIRAGNEAYGAWVRMGSHCAKLLTDGFIYAETALLIAGRQEMVQRLLDVNFLEPGEGGYQLHDYLVYNPSREEVLAQRQAKKDRQERWREKRRGPNGRYRGQERRTGDASHNASRNASQDVAESPYPLSPSPSESEDQNPPVVPLLAPHFQKLGVLMPDASTTAHCSRLAEGFAKQLGEEPAGVAEELINAFDEYSSGWSTPVKSPALFLKHWDAVQSLCLAKRKKREEVPPGILLARKAAARRGDI